MELLKLLFLDLKVVMSNIVKSLDQWSRLDLIITVVLL